MQKENIKFQDSTVFEGMTSIRAIIRGIDNGTNNRHIDKILFDESKMKKISKEVGYLKAVSEKYNFTLENSNEIELEKITLGNSHGGIVALCGERILEPLESAFKSSKIKENGFYAMIQGIEDPYNFGYSLRSLYACGCDGIILGERNWLSASGVVSRSSAGASEMFEIFKCDELSATKLFKENGYRVVCADERTDETLITANLKKPLLLIVGGEKRGISKSLLELTDLKVRIPYNRQFNASLSAASATTMFAYEIMKQNI